jgi:hypothetical protein
MESPSALVPMQSMALGPAAAPPRSAMMEDAAPRRPVRQRHA